MLDRIRNKRRRIGVAGELARIFPGERLRAAVREVEHHLAHLGSAFLVSPFVWQQLKGGDPSPRLSSPKRAVAGSKLFVMDHAYWGPGFSNEVIGEVLQGARARIEEQRCSVERMADEGELCARTAAAVAEGKVVGWFQGRMEWGPRALGNRSIVLVLGGEAEAVKSARDCRPARRIGWKAAWIGYLRRF